MAKIQILYWQEIPSLIEVRDQSRVIKRPLSDRYQGLIDQIAMLRKLAGTDGYLEQWNKGETVERPGDAEVIALEVAEDLEARFDDIKTQAIAKSRS